MVFEKIDGQRIHACRQFKHRFGVDISLDQYVDCKDQIVSGEAEFLGKRTNRISFFSVKVGEFEPVAVYDRRRRSIASFLTQEMAHRVLGRKIKPNPESSDCARSFSEMSLKRLVRLLQKPKCSSCPVQAMSCQWVCGSDLCCKEIADAAVRVLEHMDMSGMSCAMFGE